MKVLLVRFSAIGDCVMGAWVGTAIRKSIPDSEVYWAVQDTCSEVIDTEWMATGRLVVDKLSWRGLRWSPTLWAKQLKLFSGLRRHRFDYGFDLQGHSKTALCLRLAKPAQRASHLSTDKFAAALNHQVDVGRGTVHEVEAHHRLVSTLLPLGTERSVKLPRATSLIPGKPVTIQTGASRVWKRYPIELWRSVAQKLVTRGYPVVA
ncbi:MAG: glycosyltransferase family 9 protein, partial [Armatimonadota bacterium]